MLLSDLARRPLPTVREAAARIVDAHGKVEERDGRIVSLPAQVSPDPRREDAAREPLLDAARVLVAAREIVVPALQSRSSKDLADRLPDLPIGIDGGVVAA